MYKVVWLPTASEHLRVTLEYWITHNKSAVYSLKIVNKVIELEKEITKNPFFLATYLEHIKLYRKVFFGGKFAVFYEIEDKTIFIHYFRSSRQKPL